jgi:hypothetical protein
MPILMVGWASHIGRGFLFVRKPDFRDSFEVSGIALSVGFSCVAMLARSSCSANLGCLPEASFLGANSGPCIIFASLVRNKQKFLFSRTMTSEFMPASGRLFDSSL